MVISLSKFTSKCLPVLDSKVEALRTTGPPFSRLVSDSDEQLFKSVAMGEVAGFGTLLTPPCDNTSALFPFSTSQAFPSVDDDDDDDKVDGDEVDVSANCSAAVVAVAVAMATVTLEAVETVTEHVDSLVLRFLVGEQQTTSPSNSSVFSVVDMSINWTLPHNDSLICHSLLKIIGYLSHFSPLFLESMSMKSFLP